MLAAAAGARAKFAPVSDIAERALAHPRTADRIYGGRSARSSSAGWCAGRASHRQAPRRASLCRMRCLRADACRRGCQANRSRDNFRSLKSCSVARGPPTGIVATPMEYVMPRCWLRADPATPISRPEDRHVRLTATARNTLDTATLGYYLRRGRVEHARSGLRRARLHAGQPLAQSQRVPQRPRRDRRVPHAQVEPRTRLSPDQEIWAFGGLPHRVRFTYEFRRRRPVPPATRNWNSTTTA